MNKKIILLPVMICLILFGCSVPDAELVAPVWNISLKKIPLLKADTVNVGEELQGENVQADENGLLHGTFVDTTDFSIDNQLMFEPVSMSFQGVLGIVRTIDYSTLVEINRDDLNINTATIESGNYYFSMTFMNQFDYNVEMEVDIPQLYNQGAHFIRTFTVPPGNSYQEFNISNHVLELYGQDLTVNCIAHIPEQDTPPGPGEIGKLTVDFYSSKLWFSEVNADIINIQEIFADIEQEVFSDPPDELENLQFDQTDFIVRCLNIPFNIAVQLDFTTEKKGVINYLTKGINIPAGSTAPYSINISDLLNEMPERIIASGFGSISGDDITVVRGTKFQIEYSLDVPLRFSFTEASTIEESEELDLDTDARDAIEKNLENVSLEGTIVNDTPLSGKIDFYVGVTENNINNLLFTVDLPQGRTEGTINVSVDKQRLNYLISANWSKVVITVDSVFDAEIKNTDHVIIKNFTLSGTGRIDTSD